MAGFSTDGNGIKLLDVTPTGAAGIAINGNFQILTTHLSAAHPHSGHATKVSSPTTNNLIKQTSGGDMADAGIAASAVVTTARSISTTAPLSGGGDLSGNRTLTIAAASGSAPGSMSAAHYTLLTDATDANTGGTLVKRDGSGAFAAGTITADYFVGDGSGLTGVLTVIPGLSSVLSSSDDAGGLSLSAVGNISGLSGSTISGFDSVTASAFMGSGANLTSLDPSNILGYPADPTKLLNGNGAWSSPSTATHGVEVLASAYTCTSSYADSGLEVTLADAGDYLIIVNARTYNTTGAGAYVNLRLALDGDPIAGTETMGGASSAAIVDATAPISIPITVSAGQVVSLQAKWNGAGSGGVVASDTTNGLTRLTWVKLA